MSGPAREISIIRVFDAPRLKVWQYWTDPEYLKRWFGPVNYTTPYYSVDLRVGGKYLNCMRSPEGKDYWGTGTYLEIVEGKHLVSTDAFADKDGNIVPPSTYGMEGDWPADAKIDLTFEEVGEKTRLTLRHINVPPGDAGDQTEQSWKEILDRLAEFTEINKGGSYGIWTGNRSGYRSNRVTGTDDRTGF